jgi:hypothetical protein
MLSYPDLARYTDAARVVALALAVAIAYASEARPVGVADTSLVVRTLSTSPMTPDSHVQAHFTECSLVINQAGRFEQKQLVLPLARLDEHSFRVIQNAEWGWFVEAHAQQRQHVIESTTAKRSDRLAEVYLHVCDQKSAERLRDALVSVVHSCRRGR